MSLRRGGGAFAGLVLESFREELELLLDSDDDRIGDSYSAPLRMSSRRTSDGEGLVFTELSRSSVNLDTVMVG